MKIIITEFEEQKYSIDDDFNLYLNGKNIYASDSKKDLVDPEDNMKELMRFYR